MVRDESPNTPVGGPEVATWDNGRVNRVIAPSVIAPPAAHYAHAVVSLSPTRLLHTSGVVPVSVDGVVPSTVAEQAEVVWSNIEAILSEAQMRIEDIVSVTTYVVAGNDLSVVMATRDRILGDHVAASTLVTVPALARPEWHLEIAVVAAS